MGIHPPQNGIGIGYDQGNRILPSRAGPGRVGLPGICLGDSDSRDALIALLPCRRATKMVSEYAVGNVCVCSL